MLVDDVDNERGLLTDVLSFLHSKTVQTAVLFVMQQAVHFNVGGVPFTLLKETVLKYPNSLLAKLVKDFQEKVENGEYISIDRHPKSFPWIVEIYRDGDYASCVPDMTVEALEKELKWYRLPMTKLTTEIPKSIEPPNTHTCPISLLFHDIISEIYACGLIHMLPLDVFVYQEYKDKKLESTKPKILVVLPTSFGMKYVNDRGHRSFINALVEGTNENACTTHPWGKVLTSTKNTKLEFWVVHFGDPIKLRLLNAEASKLEMECTCRKEKYGSSDNEIEWDVLSIQYKAVPVPIPEVILKKDSEPFHCTNP